MANWKYHCPILPVVQDDALSDRERLRSIASLIASCPGFDGEELPQEFRDAADEDDDRLVEHEGNRLLAYMYDFADANLIWTGP